ncbi:hypothetical protein GCM10020001_113120 [Nonomuraea salmonea]
MPVDRAHHFVTSEDRLGPLDIRDRCLKDVVEQLVAAGLVNPADAGRAGQDVLGHGTRPFTMKGRLRVAFAMQDLVGDLGEGARLGLP